MFIRSKLETSYDCAVINLLHCRVCMIIYRKGLVAHPRLPCFACGRNSVLQYLFIVTEAEKYGRATIRRGESTRTCGQHCIPSIVPRNVDWLNNMLNNSQASTSTPEASRQSNNSQSSTSTPASSSTHSNAPTSSRYATPAEEFSALFRRGSSRGRSTFHRRVSHRPLWGQASGVRRHIQQVHRIITGCGYIVLSNIPRKCCISKIS